MKCDLCPEGYKAKDKRILWHIQSGCTNSQISETMGVSPSCVKNRILKLMERLDVNDRTALVIKAISLGIVERRNLLEKEDTIDISASTLDIY